MKQYGFPKRMRITRRREFQALWQEGHRLRGNLLLLIVRKNSFDHPRIGIAASKKRMRRAVDRNRFKRLVREAFRLHRNETPFGIDAIVVPTKAISSYTLPLVSTELVSLFRKARRKWKGQQQES